ncbi:hypothetical protein BJX64DRAFT_293322 [Aspergillus heterothallicus]
MQDANQKEIQALKYKDRDAARDDFNDELLRMVLERCIEARKEAIGPSAHVSHPLLRRDAMKGQEMMHPNLQRNMYFLANSSYTIAREDSSGHMRDYFIILRDRRLGEKRPLIVYMVIVHKRLKERGKRRYGRIIRGLQRHIMQIRPLMDAAKGMTDNTCAFNATGHPALALPIGFVPARTDESIKLPASMQIVGKWYDKATILRVAYAWEQAVDWKTF